MSKLNITKACSECGIEKPLKEFRKQRSTKDGRKYRCVVCDDHYQKSRYAAKQQQIIQNSRDYRAKKRAEKLGIPWVPTPPPAPRPDNDTPLS